MKKKPRTSKSKLNKQKKNNYLESFIEYQDKQYLPGAFLGGEIHPALKAQSRIGGYLMIIAGTFLFVFYMSPLFGNLPIDNVLRLFPLVFSSLLILVGWKFARGKTRKK
ncbi:hypothetical protein KBC70_01430 [Candidatus Woesebacteria bacterium]|nr:hypothetical protein [Candidatus Woesebacteria bacterium]